MVFALHAAKASHERSGRLAKVNRASCKWAATHQVVARPQLAEMDLGKPVSERCGALRKVWHILPWLSLGQLL